VCCTTVVEFYARFDGADRPEQFYNVAHSNHLRLFISPASAAGNAFGRVCLSLLVCVCPVRAVTVESPDTEISFLICAYILYVTFVHQVSECVGFNVSLDT